VSVSILESAEKLEKRLKAFFFKAQNSHIPLFLLGESLIFNIGVIGI